MALSIILVVLGFVLLVAGAAVLVDGASSLAAKFGVPAIVIGLTIVAFGTSSPELFVNIFASVNRATDITLGNVIGSNIFNVMVIIGITSLITPLSVKNNTTWIEVPMSLIAAVLVWVCANDTLVEGRAFAEISRIDGIFLLVLFLVFMVYNFYLAKGEEPEDVRYRKLPAPLSLVMIAVGMALLGLGGHFVVNSSVEIARVMGIPERVIGITIVSIGTSLPELVTSLVAAAKKNIDIAIGNIVGSNCFNIFFILGLSAVIYPVPLSKGGNIDILVNIAAGLAMFVFIFTGKGRRIARLEGMFLVAAYMA